MQIKFNKPYLTGKETDYIKEAVESGKISGDGMFTKKCHEFLEKKYGFGKALLTTSCTHALEMAAILIDAKPGDEIIMPAYTFVSTANAFVLRGAKIIFADSCPNNPNIDVNSIESLITNKTKAIVVVHYAGIACDMEKLAEIVKKHNLFLIEDAAQAIDSYYNNKPLGSFGDFATFSFHETKNIISGEGGALVINNKKYFKRAEIIREKGTNRSAFFRGEVDKYNWVDVGSSYLPSEIISAFLYAQLENLEDIQAKRMRLWNLYQNGLKEMALIYGFNLPEIPDYSPGNAHLYYLVCSDGDDRNGLIDHLRANGIHAVFHYISLEHSPYYKKFYSGKELTNSKRFEESLVRLPLYYELKESEVIYVIDKIRDYYSQKLQPE